MRKRNTKGDCKVQTLATPPSAPSAEVIIDSERAFQTVCTEKKKKHGGVMLLIYRDISHMPITELENNSESVWVKNIRK